MTARGYEISLRVYFTIERSERVKYFSSNMGVRIKFSPILKVILLKLYCLLLCHERTSLIPTACSRSGLVPQSVQQRGSIRRSWV